MLTIPCKKLITKKRIGVYTCVPRALRIISRYAYYHEKIEDVKIIEEILKLWCGFADTEKESICSNPSFKEIKGWLPRYLKDVLSDDAKRYNALKEDLTKRRKKLWCRGAFQQSGSVNDEHSIYFESIIAEAIEQGELKEYYLAFDRDPLEGYDRKPKALYDRGLKLVAAWLLNRIPESDYAWVDFAAYSNWVKTGCTDGGKVTSRVIPELTYSFGSRSKVQIFSCDYIDSVNKHNPMLCLDKEWEKLYNPRLLSNPKETNGVAFVFADKGCDSPLKEL